MVFLEHNSKYLAQRNPDLYRKLTVPEPRYKYPDTNILLGVNERNEPHTVMAAFNGLPPGPVDNPDFARQWIMGVTDKTGTVVVYGFGMGYHIDEIMKRWPEKKIIIIEPDLRIIFFTMHIRNLEHIFDKCMIITDEDVTTTMNILTSVICNPTNKGVQLITYSVLCPQFQAQLLEEAERFLSDFSTMVNTKNSICSKWYENRIRNIAVPSVDAKKLIGKFSGIPGVLVGAGPSLKKQLNLLRKIQGKAVIVAASTAAEVLINNGIQPTLMVAIDQDPKTSGGLHENLDSDIPLLWDGQIAQNSLKYKGKKFQFSLNVNKYARIALPDMQVIESGPSVSNASLDVMCQLGCNPILVVGQDLSYTDGKMYCDGTQFQQENLTSTMKVKDRDGNDIETEACYVSIRNWFEAFMNRLKNLPKMQNRLILSQVSGYSHTAHNLILDAINNQFTNLTYPLPEIYNCTPKGLPIKYMPYKDFASAIKFYDMTKEYDFGKMIDEVYYKADGEPDYIDTSKIHEVNKNIHEELRQIKEMLPINKGLTSAMQQFKAFQVLADLIDLKLYHMELEAEYAPDKAIGLKHYIDRRFNLINETLDWLMNLLLPEQN